MRNGYSRGKEITDLKSQEALIESLQAKLKEAKNEDSKKTREKLTLKYSSLLNEALERKRELMRQVEAEKDRYSVAMQRLQQESSRLHKEILHPEFELDRTMTKENMKKYLAEKDRSGIWRHNHSKLTFLAS